MKRKTKLYRVIRKRNNTMGDKSINTSEVSIPSWCQVVIAKPNETQPRKRYIAYDPNAESIFVEDWGIQGSIKDYLKENQPKINFPKSNVIVARDYEAPLQDYLDASAFCSNSIAEDTLGATPTYEAVNSEDNAKKSLTDDIKVIKAKSIVYEAPITELIAYARVIGVPTTDIYGVNKESDEIRWDLASHAQRDPEAFIRRFNSETSKREFILIDAKDKGVVKTDVRANALYWADGSVIKTSPTGVNVISHFAETCDSSEEDLAAFMEICARSGNDYKGFKSVKQDITKTELKMSTAEELFERAKNVGVIAWNAEDMGFHFQGKFISKQKKPLFQEIEGNEEFRNALIEAIGEKE